MNRLAIQLSTVGSSENQPPPPKRRRSRALASFFANNDVVCDSANLQPVDKRACMDKAEKRVTKQLSKNAARGDSIAPAKARWTPKPATTPNDPEDVDKPVDTLKRILMHDKTTLILIMDSTSSISMLNKT